MLQRHSSYWLILFLAFRIAGAQSQSDLAVAPADPPRFEVASVRPSGPDQHELNGLYTYPGGRIVARGCTLQALLLIAYNIQPFQISGGPAWASVVNGSRFDIEAKPLDSSLSARWQTTSPKLPPGEEERKMLQALLAERFHLQLRRESREHAVYLLVRGSGHLQLTPPKNDKEYSWAGSIRGGLPDGNGLRGTNISMPEFAARLSRWLERPVIDRTGLQGSFDFDYHSEDSDSTASSDVTDSILVSLKGIGLALQPSKAPTETILIEHAEKPTEN